MYMTSYTTNVKQLHVEHRVKIPGSEISDPGLIPGCFIWSAKNSLIFMRVVLRLLFALCFGQQNTNLILKYCNA